MYIRTAKVFSWRDKSKIVMPQRMFELLSIRKQSVTALFMLTKIFKNLVI
jgi:hypothetical protein